MRKICIAVVMFCTSIVLFAGIVVNGQSLSNGQMITLYKNVSKQDVGMQGGSMYYLLQDIPIQITESNQCQVHVSSEGFSGIFSKGTPAYMVFSNETQSVNLFENGDITVFDKTVSSDLNTTLSLYFTSGQILDVKNSNTSPNCYIKIYYGTNLSEFVTINLVIQYAPDKINKANGDKDSIMKPDFQTDSLNFDLGADNRIGESPKIKTLSQTANFFTATRNILVTYTPGYIENCGVDYSYEVAATHNSNHSGAFNDMNHFFLQFNTDQDQYLPFDFTLTVFPTAENAVFTKSGNLSINGQFVLTYFS